jgi:hypothetical protein
LSKKLLLPLAALAATAALSACDTYGSGYGPGYASDNTGWGYYDRAYYSRYGRYDWNSPDPRYNGYYADNYYRTDRRYREYRLGSNDRIYRGRDGRYYCRRSDGTTGLIVGAVAGGILGSIIAPGDSKPLGAVIGAIGGGAAGAAIDSNNPDVRCQ